MENENKNAHSGHRKRIAERFMNYPDSLAPHELLEMLLFYAIPRKNTNPIAHKLLDKFGSLKNVFNANVKSLASVEGVGKSTAIFIKLVSKTHGLISDDKSKSDAYNTIKNCEDSVSKHFEGLTEEKVIIFFLNSKYEFLEKIEFTDKLKNQATIDTTVISKQMATCNPYFAILAHNHPGKEATSKPSIEDDCTTGKINMLCCLNGVILLDHIVVSNKDCYSYHCSGRLDAIKQEYAFNKIDKEYTK